MEPQTKAAKSRKSSPQPTCQVGNYGLARKQSLLAIAERRNSRPTYRLYRAGRSEWLVIAGETIVVQEKHKQELAMDTLKFFEPSFEGARKPQPNAPIVEMVATQMEWETIRGQMEAAVKSHDKRIESIAYHKHCVRKLLDSENVQLIDFKILRNRIRCANQKLPQRANKVAKIKDRGRTPALPDQRKLTPQQTLRASNRPKATSSSPKQNEITLPRRINYKPSNALLPINEHVLEFYERSKAIGPKKVTENMPKQLKLTYLKREQLSSQPKKCPTAINIKSDGVKKKLPEKSAKRKKATEKELQVNETVINTIKMPTQTQTEECAENLRKIKKTDEEEDLFSSTETLKFVEMKSESLKKINKNKTHKQKETVKGTGKAPKTELRKKIIKSEHLKELANKESKVDITKIKGITRRNSNIKSDKGRDLKENVGKTAKKEKEEEEILEEELFSSSETITFERVKEINEEDLYSSSETLKFVENECDEKSTLDMQKIKDNGVKQDQTRTAIVPGSRIIKSFFNQSRADNRRASEQLPANLRRYCRNYVTHSLQQRDRARNPGTTRIGERVVKELNRAKWAQIQPAPKIGFRQESDLNLLLGENFSLALEKSQNNSISLGEVRRVMFVFYLLLLVIVVLITLIETNPLFWRWVLRRLKYFYHLYTTNLQFMSKT